MTTLRPFRLLIASALAAAAIGSLAAPARAHFIWLAPGGTPTESSPAKPDTLEIYFGESAAPDNPRLLDTLKEMKLWRLTAGDQPSALAAERSGDTLAAKLPAENPDNPAIYVAAHDLGVRDKGGEKFRLMYYAKSGPSASSSAWQNVDASGVSKLDIVPRLIGDKVSLAVRFDGSPSASAEVLILGPDDSDGEDFAGETDADGHYVFTLADPGRYSIRVRHVETSAGQVGEKSYDVIRHYATLTLDVPTSDASSGEADDAADTASAATATETIGKLPVTLTSFGGAVLGDDVYIYGGTMGASHQYGKELQSDSLMRMKLTGGDWETVARGPRLQGLALVPHGGKLYRIGGFEARNAAGDDQDLWSVDSVASFDPATGQWSDMPPLPEPRSSFDAVVLGDHIYVVGGWGMAGDAKRVWHETAWKLDLTQDQPKWTSIAATPFERRALALAAHDGKLYAIGGISSGDETSRETDIYDPATDSWTTGPELVGDSGMTGFGASAFATGGELYITTVTGSLQKLAKDGSQWTVVSEMPTGRFFHRMLPAGDDAFVLIGGSNMKGRITDVERIGVH
jgi:N-acetylneuraminic acid mutarotase